MKGVSLPINTVVLLVLAVIIVAATVLFFMGVIGPGTTEMSNDQIRVLCCARIDCETDYGTGPTGLQKIAADCNIEGVDGTRVQQAFGTGMTPANIWSECGCS